MREQAILHSCALDILTFSGMLQEKKYKQHGNISCYEHSLAVAHTSVKLANFFRIRVDMASLVRGALLHDYFLYDWHMPNEPVRFHAFTHANRALQNAERDFILNDIQRDIIQKHMFPLTPNLPRYKESAIVIIADKLCATREVFCSLILFLNSEGLRYDSGY